MRHIPLLRRPILLITLALLGGCAATGSGDRSPGTDSLTDITAEAGTETAKPEPELISRLPPAVESFDYDGYRHFTEVDAGYSVRYLNTRKKRSAEIYIYPVAQENRAMEHDQLVMGSTRATLKAIGKAVSQGLYANFSVVGAATHARGVRTVARVQTTYVRENLAMYSVLYQTEHDGTLVKIRINMPDNESNQANDEWDRFALRLIDLVTRKTPSTAPAAPGSV